MRLLPKRQRCCGTYCASCARTVARAATRRRGFCSPTTWTLALFVDACNRALPPPPRELPLDLITPRVRAAQAFNCVLPQHEPEEEPEGQAAAATLAEFLPAGK